MLVLITVGGIGYLIYAMVPGIPLVAAFALAAVLPPTDAMALSGIVGKGRIPKPIMGVLEGEALMNCFRPGVAKICHRGGDGHRGVHRQRCYP